MASLNCFSFTGRLGSDAQVKKTPNGKVYMEMSVAVDTGYGDYKKTIWIKVKQWGERVNNIVGLFTKGSLVAAAGELDLSTWTGKDGQEKTDTIVTCSNIQVLSSKKKDADSTPAEELTF